MGIEQVIHMKKSAGAQDFEFLLMNSFSTSHDTKEYLKKFEKEIGNASDLEFVQNKAPKATRMLRAMLREPFCRSHAYNIPIYGHMTIPSRSAIDMHIIRPYMAI